MSELSGEKKGGMGCAILFLMPFLLVGLGVFGSGLWTLYIDQQFREDTVAKLAFGAIFTLVGGGLMTALFFGWRKDRELRVLQGLHPDAPWRWQKDWEVGRIRSSTFGSMIGYWIFGIAFSVASAPVFLNLDEILRKAPMGYAAFLFPLVGVAMVLVAIYATLRHFKYGRTHCDLLSNPGVVGGWFRAVIWANLKVAGGERVETQLSCFHCYTTGSGKNRTSHRKVLWQETMTVMPEYLATNAEGLTAIPVKLYVPRDCIPTTPGAPSDRKEWELSAKAAVAGIDFLSQFIVPVFVTEDSQETPPEDVGHELASTTPTPYHPAILLSEGVDSLDLYGPPRRNLSATFSITLFTVIWSVVILAMLYSGEVPLLFPIVFGIFDLLLVSATIWMLFGHARVRIEHGNVHLSRTVFGIGPRSTIPLGAISRVDSHITMQSGTTAYYSIRLYTNSGKKSVLGGIRNKDEVNALITRLEQAIDAGKSS